MACCSTVLSIVLALEVVGCNALSGVEDLKFDGDAGGSSAIASSGGDGNGGASGSAGSSGTAGGPGDEDCTNGVDDDADGLADCDDPGCIAGGFACVPGAAGYFLAPGSACPADATPTPLYSCLGCNCTGSQPMCAVSMDAYDTGDCSNNPYGASVMVGADVCYDINDISSSSTVGLEIAVSPAPPTCQATEPGPFSGCLIARVGTCAGGACIPPGGCVLSPSACGPPFSSSVEIVHMTGAGACGCACTGDVQCDSDVEVFDGNGCAGAQSSVLTSGNCENAGLDQVKSIRISATTRLCTATSMPSVPVSSLCCLP